MLSLEEAVSARNILLNELRRTRRKTLKLSPRFDALCAVKLVNTLTVLASALVRDCLDTRNVNEPLIFRKNARSTRLNRHP